MAIRPCGSSSGARKSERRDRAQRHAVFRLTVAVSPSISVTSRMLASADRAEYQLDREGFGGDLVAMRLQRLGDRPPRFDPDHDPIAHVEPRRLPQVLDRPDQIARDPFASELGGISSSRATVTPLSLATPQPDITSCARST